MLHAVWFLFILWVFVLTGPVSDSIVAASANVTDSDDVKRLDEQLNLKHVPSIGHESIHSKNDLITTDSLLFASTLDGTLFAVSKTDGKVVWSLKEDPVLNIPSNGEKGPVFFANPKDGSLYSFRVGSEGLKELSFTIPDLVSLSPCRSTDGLLYTGSKMDTWFAVDPLTGTKIQTLSMDGSQQVCPSPSMPTIFIGRTEYKVVMFDRETRQPRWNATFMDYSSHAAPNPKDYGLQHFASSSDGVIVTMDQGNGDVLWTSDLLSPVVAVYTLNPDHLFQKVPFYTFAKETLYHLTGQLTSTEWRTRFLEHGKQETIFYNTLFIGEYANNLYALPSLVDTNTVTVTPKNVGLPLIAGPSSSDTILVDGAEEEVIRVVPSPKVDEKNLILLGYHEVPDVAPGKLTHPPPRLIADKSTLVIPVYKNKTIDIQHPGTPGKALPSNETIDPGLHLQTSNDFNKALATAAITGFFFAIIFICFGIGRRKTVQNALPDAKVFDVSNSEWEIASKVTCVGKITFDTDDILGHGCSGTEVFKGRFDGRDVAVKRLLPHLFSLAEREVNLLRESDHHHNVIRYFCTEQDTNFRYIAFELCMATVHDYVEMKDFDRSCISTNKLLEQMMSGIDHLHTLNIVHRDIKPHNVLLSKPDARGHVRAMISDFGLCKKLTTGRQSMSKVSGVTGTIGWIAPEMIEQDQKITCAVDIFSAGCVLYYVLSNGHHPFGDSHYRQPNILNDEFCLKHLSNEVSTSNLAKDLVKKMVFHTPSKRLSAKAVLKHPFFWSSEKQLQFLNAVSNRLEKVLEEDVIVLRLQANGLRIVKSDWSQHIGEEIVKDLRGHRSYNYHSVRDLLRAIRNKHHHFAQLGKNIQQTLGEIPDKYLEYFTSRFPLLVLHVYNAMNVFVSEPSMTSIASFY